MPLIRALLIGLLFGGLMIAVVNQWLDPTTMTAFMAGHRDMAVAIFLAYHIAGTLFFVPRTFIGIAAGVVFGFWLGLLLAVLGAVLGALAAFWFARLINAGWINLGATPGLGPWLARAEQSGIGAVALIRLLPMHGSAVSYGLGLTRISSLDYALGTAIGVLPVSIATADLGASGAGILNGEGSILGMVAGVGALIALSVIGTWIMRQRFYD